MLKIDPHLADHRARQVRLHCTICPTLVDRTVWSYSSSASSFAPFNSHTMLCFATAAFQKYLHMQALKSFTFHHATVLTRAESCGSMDRICGFMLSIWRMWRLTRLDCSQFENYPPSYAPLKLSPTLPHSSIPTYRGQQNRPHRQRIYHGFAYL